jgi:putative protease
MRVHRASHNFENPEIEEAISIAHGLQKKVYITFNNMMTDGEMKDSVGFLKFLEAIKPDALIIQDFGALRLIRSNNIHLDMHLSVMSNVHNLEMVKEAEQLGVSRVVISREVSLDEIKAYVAACPTMEYEYFIHGDMCSVNGGQCYLGGVLFDSSSNRGRCMKPCRWAYQVGEKKIYPFAAKDLSLYRHIPQLLESGVNSFKIEGRMRDADYLTDIIAVYAKAIDRYMDDPTAYYTELEGLGFLEDNRVRNISTAYSFGTPGAVNIDEKGEREPRIFSLPREEASITKENVREIKMFLADGGESGLTGCTNDGNGKSDDNDVFKNDDRENSLIVARKKPRLAVSVNNMAAFKKAVDNGADILYLSGEVFRPDKPFTKEELRKARAYAKDLALYYALPRMMNARQFQQADQLIPMLQELGIGLLAGNLGAMARYKEKGLEIIGDYGLNIYNQEAAKFYQEEGAGRVTLSIEATAKVVKEFFGHKEVEAELIVQGRPSLMYMEHCLKAAEHGLTADDWCLEYCMREDLDMIDARGYQRKIRADRYCRNHLIPTKDFCYLPILDELIALGVDVIRIEGKDYSPEKLAELVQVYKKAMNGEEVSLDYSNQSLQSLIFTT